jgi:predicted glycoside hydrolase/deacetylase ChbG (UPF0249 family)
MELTATWVAAIASVVSALVVAVTAIAAFAQIRYIRASNEITVFLRTIERVDSPEFATAFAAIGPLRERLATDPELRLRLSKDDYVEEFRSINTLLQFMEHLATLVVTSRISEHLVFAEYADNIDQLWDQLGDMVYLRRQARGRYVGVAFEHLAMRAKRFVAEGRMDQIYGRLEKDPRLSSPSA